jgi:hypothetical protein
MWAHAEDLDTLEFTLMQIVTYIAGPVRILFVFTIMLALLIQLRMCLLNWRTR